MTNRPKRKLLVCPDSPLALNISTICPLLLPVFSATIFRKPAVFTEREDFTPTHLNAASAHKLTADSVRRAVAERRQQAIMGTMRMDRDPLQDVCGSDNSSCAYGNKSGVDESEKMAGGCPAEAAAAAAEAGEGDGAIGGQGRMLLTLPDAMLSEILGKRVAVHVFFHFGKHVALPCRRYKTRRALISLNPQMYP